MVANLTGNLQSQISSITVPTSSTFLAAYDNRYVNVIGDTMTGDLTTSGIFTDRRKLFQTNSFDAVNTQYFHIGTLTDYSVGWYSSKRKHRVSCILKC
jgi:hypothetical protein